MRAKKVTQRPRSIRYLLSADSRFRKLSLRKLTDRVKQARSSMRSRRPKTAARAKAPVRFPWLMTPQAIVLGTICVLGGAALITARQPVPQPESAAIGAPADVNTPAPIPAAMPPRSETKMTLAPKMPARPAVSPTRAAAVPTKPAVPPTRAAPVPAAKPAPVETVNMSASEPSPKATPVAPAPKADDVEAAPTVTITGCLVRDEDTFWLKDTSGADAPKSRSWKSGFLKKRSARIEVMDPTSSLRLRGYVGERISATGVLTNREMQARAVRRVGGSCD